MCRLCFLLLLLGSSGRPQTGSGANSAARIPPSLPGGGLPGAPGLFELTAPAQRGAPLTLRGDRGLAASSTRIFIANQEAKIIARRTIAAGREEVSVQLPAGFAPSCAIPVTAVGAGGLPGNTILAQLTDRGAACPSTPWDQFLGRQGPTGLVLLARSVQAGAIADDAVALFLNRRQPTATLLPAPGTCVLYRTSDAFDLQSALVPQLVGRLPDPASEPALDAGARLLLTRGSQARALNPRSAGFYTRRAGGAGEPPFLDPGSWMLSAPGGRGLPAFSLSLQAPDPFQAQLPEPGDAVSRADGLSLSWTPAGMPPLVVALLFAPDRQNRAMAGCLCTALSATGRLRMPPWLLRALPPGPAAGLALTALPERPAPFLPQSLQNSAALSVYVRATSIELR
jgi:hypothetical protein